MNTYQEILISEGYQAASLYAYLANMADKEGNMECSLRQLGKVSGLSVQQVRRLLLCYQTTQLITLQTTHLSTQITICKRDVCKRSQNTKQHTKQHTKEHTKESTFFPPLDVSPIPPSLSPPIIPQEAHTLSACERFSAWLSQECPYIAAHLKPLTDVELDKLKKQFCTEDIMRVCHEIENRKDLRKRYTNLYRTLLNWLNRNENNRTTHPTTKEQRLQSAYGLMQRIAAEDGVTLS